jgi:hypothetical protein
MAPHTKDLSIKMTTDGGPVCQRCKTAFPQGVTLAFVHNSGGRGFAGRLCCDGCKQYYFNKKLQEEKKNLAQSSCRLFVCGGQQDNSQSYNYLYFRE